MPGTPKAARALAIRLLSRSLPAGARIARVEDESLSEWRRGATDAVTLAAVVLHLPALSLFLEGYGPPVAPQIRIGIAGSFVVVATAAVLRRVDHRIRVSALLVCLYLVALIGAIPFPDSPYVRMLPVAAPMLAMGLFGERPARVAMVCSAGVLLFAPFLRFAPGLARMAGMTDRAPVPMAATSLQGLGLTAMMLVLMILAERFYAFLSNAVAAERRACAERTAARRKLESEMEQRRRLQHEIARIADEERRDLGQDIHDGVCQQLTGALLRCQALELRLERGTPPSTAELGALSSLLGDTIHEARAVAQGLCPLEPTPDALAPALRELARRSQQVSGVLCQFLSAGDVAVPHLPIAQHLYRLAQEAVSNAVRHAGASRIQIELRGNGDELVLQVEDDGVGLPATVPPGGMGLRTMAFRAHIVEGRFALERAPGGGTRVSCRVPRAAVAGIDGTGVDGHRQAVQPGSAT